MEKKEINRLSDHDTLQLCQNIRQRMIEHFSKQGGYLCDNLAAVDIAVELAKVFDSNDFILFSKENLSYAQNILLEEGYCDSINENVSFSEAMGVIASKSRCNKNCHVVYVMSDQDILDFNLIKQLQANDFRLIIVYLDRHDKDVNALNKIVNDLRQTEMYNGLKKGVKKSLSNMRSSEQIISGIHRFKDSVKKAIIDEDVFKRYNIDYLGPIDGHDHRQLNRAFRNVRKNRRLVVVHCLVKPGKGYSFAEKGEIPSFTMPFNPKDGRPYLTENEKNRKPFSIISKMIEELLSKNNQIICISNDALELDGMADLFAGFPDRCLQVKTNEEDFLYLIKGTIEAGMIPSAYVSPSILIKYISNLKRITSLQEPALLYTYDDPALSYKILSEIEDSYVVYPKDSDELRNTVFTFDKINKPVIIITEKQCLSYEEKDPVMIEDLGKWEFLVNNKKGKAVILGNGTDLLKLKDIIIANELPYDLVNCFCLNAVDNENECINRIRKNYKHKYYYGKNDLISNLINDITIIDDDMEQIFARIKKDLHA
ncbi:MAG: hypothetical protein IJL85_07470 [Erysipelotrichaceae bacterium]|nr:hypothetical protein [Erysipelotrichaceae bacterium]